MNERVKKYIDDLFSDIADSKQLQELKEEVCSNLSERITESTARGLSDEEAFKAAIAELGDVSELADSMRKVSNTGIQESIFYSKPLDKKHVFGYVGASAIILFGILTAGIVQLQQNQPFITIATLLPFLIVSSVLFVFLGLTQETIYNYPMNKKRALAYSLSTALFLFGIMTAGIEYYQGMEPFIVLATFIPFVLPAILAFIYLGLTEKSRMKLDQEWAREWMEKWSSELKHHYHSPRYGMVRGGISGALWLFSIAIFLLVGLNGGWKYSWIVFIFACGIEALMEAIFAHRRKS